MNILNVQDVLIFSGIWIFRQIVKIKINITYYYYYYKKAVFIAQFNANNKLYIEESN